MQFTPPPHSGDSLDALRADFDAHIALHRTGVAMLLVTKDWLKIITVGSFLALSASGAWYSLQSRVSRNEQAIATLVTNSLEMRKQFEKFNSSLQNVSDSQARTAADVSYIKGRMEAR